MIPEKLEKFMYALMKEARRDSLMDFIEYWNITEDEYEEIEQWFSSKFEIKL